MNKMNRRFMALTIVVGLLLAIVGTVYAEGELLPRFTFVGAGGSVSTEQLTIRSAMGAPLSGGALADSGSTLCTGFGCGAGAVSMTPSAPTPTSLPPTSQPPTSTPIPSETPVPGSSSDIVIHEVYYHGDADGDWIELKNIGTGTVDISEWYFCARFSYKQLSDGMTALKGDLTLAPGEYVVLQAWTDLDPDGSGSDLAIYRDDASKEDGRPAFDSADYMVDFVQWGTGEDVGRPDVATVKGIWAQTSTDPVRYDYVQRAPDGQSLALISNNRGSASVDFDNGTPTQGSSNSSDPSSSSKKTYLPFVSGGAN